MTKNIAIIGAGIAGLTAAHQLKTQAEITIFEKSCGVGGRMATKCDNFYGFDHGAQFFTINSPTFSKFLQPHIEADVVYPWDVSVVDLDRESNVLSVYEKAIYVAAPGMNALCKKLAENQNIHLETEITTTLAEESGTVLEDQNGQAYGPFDWIISAVPAPQALALLPLNFSQRPLIENVDMTGCFTLMLGLKSEGGTIWDAAFIDGSPIRWLAWNRTKPGRPNGDSLVVQSSNEWADAHMNDDLAEIEKIMLAETERLLEGTHLDIDHCALHRWRYADVLQSAGEPCLVDVPNRLAACGDWCIQGRVESAFESGIAVAKAISEKL